MQNLAEKKVSHCDDGHDKSDGGIVIIAVVTILMQAAAAAVKRRKLGDNRSIILKALHACHFVFAFGEWVNKSDIYANIS